jgi:hypothetical protein
VGIIAQRIVALRTEIDVNHVNAKETEHGETDVNVAGL